MKMAETNKTGVKKTAPTTAQATDSSGKQKVPVLSREEGITKIAALIKGIHIAMLTTIDKDGKMTSRPMGTQKADFDGQLWFFTKTDSGKVKCIEANQHVNVAYADPGSSKYVSVAGTGRKVDDIEKKKELWTPLLKAWFPEGPEDAETALLCIDVDSAELWEGPGKFIQLAGMAAAIATGKEFKGIGENQKVEMH
jgi:general stress protein 26